MRKSPEERFWAKVRKSENPIGCWEWIAGKNFGGYGTFRVGNRTVPAHRWAYEHLVGTIPPELECDHLCRVRCCVNPAHIELVTSRENTLRGVGLAAQNARQTTCKNGHPLVDGPKQRGCPQCRAEYKRTWEAANRENRSAQWRAGYVARRKNRSDSEATV